MNQNFEQFMSGELPKMVTAEWYGRIQKSFSTTIRNSFIDDGSTPTRDEIKRRFAICMNLFCILRRELNKAVPRCLDEIPIGLRAALDGTSWEPDGEKDRKCWIPGDPLDFMK